MAKTALAMQNLLFYTTRILKSISFPVITTYSPTNGA